MAATAHLIARVFVLCVVAGVGRAQSWSWSALTLQVEPKAEECFYEEFEQGAKLEMDYEVIRGGLLDIRLVISGPSTPLYDKVSFFNREDDAANEKLGHIVLDVVQPGVHSICFNNVMSRWTAKVVSFAVKSSSPKDTIENAKLEHLGPVVDSVIKVSEELDAIERIQHHLRIREQLHRDTQESTNSRVQWLAISKAIILISLSSLQLFFIRSWFSDVGQRRRV
ncbi:GOLD domain-containing protein [Plasmodiophora brassicae]